MSKRVLFVDDDPMILKGVSRQFEDSLEFELANSPEEALQLIERSGPFAVVVSDMRMPGMTGIELLTEIRLRSSDTVRIMLTGYADLQSTIQSVNEGNVFRFLSKPCSHELLEQAVQDGLGQYRLLHAERDLLEGTLQGSVKVLSEMLSLVNPLAFGRTSQVRRIAMATGAEMSASSLWDLDIASMLFPLGCITVSESALEQALAGKPIPQEEEAAFAQHAALASDMLKNIPRLETVASIISFQDKAFDGSGLPQSGVKGVDIPLGARILKVSSDFELAYKRQGDASAAVERLESVRHLYDPAVLSALRSALRKGLCQTSSKEVEIADVKIGMVLAADVRTKSDQLMVAAGQTVTETIKRRLQTLFEDRFIGATVGVEILTEVNHATCCD